MSILLKRYIRSVLKEDIGPKDHQAIVSTMKSLDSLLKQKSVGGKSMSLSNLNIDERMICKLRDNKSLKVDSNITKPASYDPADISVNINKEEIFGLGFNPVNVLKKEKEFYEEKINKALEYYEEKINNNSKNRQLFIELATTIMRIQRLSECIKQLGIKVLGAGIYRVAVVIPGAESVIVKIALNEKAKKDNLSEIGFSTGQTTPNIRYLKNFPKTYASAKDGSWMSVEKAVMLEEILTRKDILKDIKEQFKYTFDLFEGGGLLNTSIVNESSCFVYYIGFMFNFRGDKIDNAYIDEMNKKYPKFKMLARNLKNAIFNRRKRKPRDKDHVDHIKVTDDFYKKRLYQFFIYMHSQILKTANNNSKLKGALDLIQQSDAKGLNLFSNELDSLLDQSFTTNIKDTHIGNFGFLKGLDNKWRLIFTDIDSDL
tara:strand:+ start:329 stop:1615 length:1287 start_codon:yes stop_codon:yes gene_type:complete